MSRKTWVYIIFYGSLLVAAAYFSPEEVDWTHSFIRDDTRPYGSKILYNHLEDVSREGDIMVNEESLYEIQDTLLETDASMIFIDEEIQMDSLDLHVLLEYVAAGHEVFMSATNFPYSLMDTLHLDISMKWEGINVRSGKGRGDTTYHQFYSEQLMDKEDFIFFSEDYLHHFVSADSLEQYGALAFASDEMVPVMVRRPFGKGNFYLHSQPLVFTNYYMLREKERKYISRALSYLPPGPVIWDGYYKNNKKANRDSSLRVVMARPPFKWAYYILLATMIFYLLFMVKRRQRIIPVIDQYPNESKSLVETIGSLYFSNADNKMLAMKKITHFYQNMNRRIGLRRIQKYEDQIELIYRKTSLTKEDARITMQLIRNILNQKRVSNAQLKILNSRINKITNDQQIRKH